MRNTIATTVLRGPKNVTRSTSAAGYVLLKSNYYYYYYYYIMKACNRPICLQMQDKL
jgi:hypothetical protein